MLASRIPDISLKTPLPIGFLVFGLLVLTGFQTQAADNDRDRQKQKERKLPLLESTEEMVVVYAFQDAGYSAVSVTYLTGEVWVWIPTVDRDEALAAAGKRLGRSLENSVGEGLCFYPHEKSPKTFRDGWPAPANRNLPTEGLFDSKPTRVIIRRDSDADFSQVLFYSTTAHVLVEVPNDEDPKTMALQRTGQSAEWLNGVPVKEETGFSSSDFQPEEDFDPNALPGPYNLQEPIHVTVYDQAENLQSAVVFDYSSPEHFVIDQITFSVKGSSSKERLKVALDALVIEETDMNTLPHCFFGEKDQRWENDALEPAESLGLLKNAPIQHITVFPDGSETTYDILLHYPSVVIHLEVSQADFETVVATALDRMGLPAENASNSNWTFNNPPPDRLTNTDHATDHSPNQTNQKQGQLFGASESLNITAQGWRDVNLAEVTLTSSDLQLECYQTGLTHSELIQNLAAFSGVPVEQLNQSNFEFSWGKRDSGFDPSSPSKRPISGLFNVPFQGVSLIRKGKGSMVKLVFRDYSISLEVESRNRKEALELAAERLGFSPQRFEDVPIDVR